MFIVWFITGLFIGSFLNLLICRLKKREGGILFGRSQCPYCKKTLSWYDLIPLLSFILLKGRCRYCQKPISLQYPLVEFFTGLLFGLLYLKFGFSLILFYWLIITALLIVLFVFDFQTQMIPDKVVCLGIGIALIYLAFNYTSFLSSLIAALIAGGFFALLVYLSKEKWMGKGDIKLGLFLGLLLGFPKILVCLFFAFVFGSVVGLILVALKKKSLKSEIPFGPFLIFGFFLALFFGENIIKWYIGII